MKPTQLGIISIILLSFIACSEQKELIFEEYEFEIKGYKWDPNPYKFSSFIQDSVAEQKGHYYAAWDFSYIGNIENMLKSWDMESTPEDSLTRDEIKAFEKFERKNAKKIIIERAKKKRVTIINEAHHMPQHRVFTTSLLQELYDHGYRHLGMESFLAAKVSDSTLLANKYPILSNGFYVKEPQYGNIIREAVKIGFKVFGYESQGHENSKGREINQAKNIVEYMESNPEGKYLIHCGFAHVIEGIYGGSWEKTMTGRLTEFTNIDPLTINQTTYSEKSKEEFENQFYRLTDVDEPSVYVFEDSIFGKYKEGAWCDISIFHPRTKNFNRPKWLLTGNRTIKKIDFANANIACPCLVLAYVKGEEIGRAIPYDVQETSQKEVSLVLDKNRFDVVIWNKEGKALITKIEN